MRGINRTHVVSNREVGESGEVGCRDIYIGSLALVRSTSVTRADKDAVDDGRLGQTPCESVFAPAAADDEDAEGHGRGEGRRRRRSDVQCSVRGNWERIERWTAVACGDKFWSPPDTVGARGGAAEEEGAWQGWQAE